MTLELVIYRHALLDSNLTIQPAPTVFTDTHGRQTPLGDMKSLVFGRDVTTRGPRVGPWIHGDWSAVGARGGSKADLVGCLQMFLLDFLGQIRLKIWEDGWKTTTSYAEG